MELVDFHCHLDLFPNHLDLIRESEALGIRTLTVTNAPSVWPRNRALTANCNYVRAALGLHPELAIERQNEITLFERYLDETRFVGEVGLDGSPRLRPTLQIQEHLFARILTLCAQRGGKVLTVHSREAVSRVIEMLGTHLGSDRGKVILHWFSGTKSESRAGEAAGCYFSVNVRMLQTRRGQELVSGLPPSRILTETDGPFVKIDGRPSMPKDVAKAVKELASIWRISESGAALRVRENLERLLV